MEKVTVFFAFDFKQYRLNPKIEKSSNFIILTIIKSVHISLFCIKLLEFLLTINFLLAPTNKVSVGAVLSRKVKNPVIAIFI